MTPSADQSREVAKRLAARMSLACDRTAAHRKGVIVDTRDWHALMGLAEQARAALQQQDTGHEQ